MASFLQVLLLVAVCASSTCFGQLSTTFYEQSCPNLKKIARSVMTQAVAQEPRMGASILRLFFHDCFVNGCDASVLLDDTANFTGEKSAFPNQNSLRGYELIDRIKSQVEAACNATVSCADILALAARDGVNLLVGPYWDVPLGRRDARNASRSAANSDLPGPFSSLSTLLSIFAAKGLDAQDLVALSGAHTVGQARCLVFRSRIFNDANINATFSAARQQDCHATGGNDSTPAPLDSLTPNRFDNAFYKNLVGKRGLLHSDQELFNGGATDSLVSKYSLNISAFAGDFTAAMVKLGKLSLLTGKSGEIRLNCRRVN